MKRLFEFLLVFPFFLICLVFHAVVFSLCVPFFLISWVVSGFSPDWSPRTWFSRVF